MFYVLFNCKRINFAVYMTVLISLPYYLTVDDKFSLFVFMPAKVALKVIQLRVSVCDLHAHKHLWC